MVSPSLLNSGATHAQWRAWIEAMISTYSSSDDKNCVLLLTMLSLQHYSSASSVLVTRPPTYYVHFF